MRYVNEFKAAAELANALLTETGVLIPAHRGDGPRGAWFREQRVSIADVGERIPDRTRRQIEAMAMRDLCEAGRLMRNALQHSAAVMALDLFNDWCKGNAA